MISSPFFETLNKNKPLWIIVIAALVLTGLVGYISIRLEVVYRQNHPYRSLDPVYYMYYNAKLYGQQSQENRLSIAMDEWQQNERHPLRTIPLVLLAPEWLAHPYGYMATSLPMFAIMLFVMGWTIHYRTGHVFYAIAGMSFLCCTANLFSIEYGIATYWLDAPMSYLFGAAVLSLVNSRGKNLPWVAAFAALAAFTVLSRYLSVVYILFISAPLLMYYLGRRWWEEQNYWKTVVLPVVIISLIIFPLAGTFLFKHYSSVIGFYSSYGYGVGFGVQEALSWVFNSFVTVVSPEWLWLLAVTAGANFFLIWQTKMWDTENLLISIWLASGMFLLFGVVIRTGAGVHVLPTIIPLLVLASFAPVQWRMPLNSNTYWSMTMAACLIIVVSVGFAGKFINHNHEMASNPSEQDRDDKDFEDALAEILIAEGRPVVWNVYFAEFAWKPTMVSFFQSKILPLPAGQMFFNEHLTAWQTDYPDLNPYEVANRIHLASTKWVDIAVTLSDPQQAMDASWLINDYSHIVAAEMSTRLAHDANWEKIAELSNLRYGNIIVYRNLNTKGAFYEEAFYGRLQP
jgi:hypothetical protein